ncbi:lipoprotein [Spiroplasma alleghenense]|uniref:Lipoprotein n=1 Tax=Spiroplasma alleghenense TaxID=216931 RepID=A0A345Z4L4_9MOLU|nr:lipoprotein [Spiroplasma alleghenense]AXK51543.1 hypothetical protein SALLE_v1c08730 [Spiroplasma alleghenense]
MKKLLSILSASVLVASAPLSVVACKKTIVDEITPDYSQSLKEFLDLLKSIFKENMQRQFKDLQILNAQEAKDKFEGLDIDYLWNLLQNNTENTKEYIFEKDSEEFIKLSDFLQNQVNFTVIQNDILNKVLNNPDYQKFLINKETPIRNLVNIDKIVLTDKSGVANQRIVAIDFQISTEINFLNLEQKETTQETTFSSTITILEDIDISDDVKEISNDLSDKITNDEIANKFFFTSNSANTFETATQLNKLTNFEDIFKNQIAADVLGSSQFKFKLDEVKYENPEKYTILADLTAPVDIPFNWSKDFDKVNLIKAGLKNGGSTLDNLAIEHAQRNSIFNNNSIYPELAQYLKEDPESSEIINLYNLWEHLKRGTQTSAFRTLLANKGIELDKGHETQEQRRTIGLFGTQITGIKLVYQPEVGPEIEFEMPEQFVVNKQLTSFSTTQELHNEFTRANLLFMREAYGFNQKDNSVGENNFDYTFEFQTPNAFNNKLVAGQSYNTREIFNPIFAETVDKLEAQKDSYQISSFKDFINGYSFLKASETFKINDEGYIFFYNKQGVLINSLELAQSYSTSDLEWGFQGSLSINISAGVRDDILTTEFGNQITPWKFKL